MNSACVQTLRTRLLKDAFVSYRSVSYWLRLYAYLLQSSVSSTCASKSCELTASVTHYSTPTSGYKFQNGDPAHKNSLLGVSSDVRRSSVGYKYTDSPAFVPNVGTFLRIQPLLTRITIWIATPDWMQNVLLGHSGRAFCG